MKTTFRKSLHRRKNKIVNRLKNENEIRINPMLGLMPIKLDISEKVSATAFGGISLIQEIVRTSGLQKVIDENLHLFKIHNPYFESDHILSMAFNILCGGTCLEDVERLRQDEALLNGLATKRIPDPTTAGDFLRRFDTADIGKLLDIMNSFSQTVWKQKVNKKNTDAILDVDNTIQKTYGEKKEGMALSYNGKWGFAPLIITEAATGMHLCAVNQPGNKKSNPALGTVDEWIDRSIDAVTGYFRNIYLRGDSEFSLTEKFDDWSERGYYFTFSYDKRENLVKKALLLPKYIWKRLKRKQHSHEDNGKPNFKQEFINAKGYCDIHLKKEYVAEFPYQPGKCERAYRMIVVKKVIEVKKGQQFLFEENRLFFYITNIEHMRPEEIVAHINGRCNHENKIQQLKDKDGVHALKMPAAEFNANWAYMIIGALAWNLKSATGLFMPKNYSDQVVRMEMRRFQNWLINIPCQIIMSSRQITYRFLAYNPWLEIINQTIDKLNRLSHSRA